jgi:hypothetical protein
LTSAEGGFAEGGFAEGGFAEGGRLKDAHTYEGNNKHLSTDNI